MKIEAYREMAETEVNHWFWIGRRHIIGSVLVSLKLDEEARILELGSGTGGNFSLLEKFGKLDAVEMEPEARRISSERFPEQKVWDGYLPNNLPDELSQYDLICMFDVLEHVEESRAAIKRLLTYLKPNGHLLITVPAHPFLWSEWDDFHHHFRRYTRNTLKDDVEQANIQTIKVSHFNFILMPIIIFTRMIIKLLGLKGNTGHGTPLPMINSVLASILKLEARIIKYFTIPFGVSLIGLYKKKAIK